MSSTRALSIVTEKHGCSYTASAVGGKRVEAIRSTNAIIELRKWRIISYFTQEEML